MSRESLSNEQPAYSIASAIEDIMAYFQDEPNDGRFHGPALEAAEEIWQRIDATSIAEVIANQVSLEVWKTLFEEHRDVLDEIFRKAIQEIWGTAVDKMMLEGTSPERRKYLEGIQRKAKSQPHSF
jgi:hypothetical protein